MTIKQLTERLTFSCNQKLWQVSREKNISIWPFQFCNAIGSKSLEIRMYIFFTKRKYVVNWRRCTCEVWENKVLHEFMTPSWRDLNWIKILLKVNLCQKLFFLQNMGRTCCVQKLFWMSETISVHNMFSPGSNVLNL